MDADDFEVSTTNRYLATRNGRSDWPRVGTSSPECRRSNCCLARTGASSCCPGIASENTRCLPEFLRNWATLAIETGMRRKELQALKWSDVHLEPVGKARCGYVHVRGTKSLNSKRNLPLTAIASMVLLRQRQLSQCEHVFTWTRIGSNPRRFRR